jgi:hypothetical protein
MSADPSSGQKLLEFSLERFELDNMKSNGADFALGAIGIHGPVLRVQRDLVLANSQKSAALPAASASTERTPSHPDPPARQAIRKRFFTEIFLPPLALIRRMFDAVRG